MSVCAPALHFLSLMGKYGPWKSAVAAAWARVFDAQASVSVGAGGSRRVQSKRSVLYGVSVRSLQHVLPSQLTEGDIMAMARVLQAAALTTEQHDTTEWVRNVGRNNSFYSGWRQLATRYYKFMSTDKHGRLVAIEPDTDRLCLAHAAGAALHKSLVPTNLDEYQSMSEPLERALKRIDPPASAKPGTTPFCGLSAAMPSRK